MKHPHISLETNSWVFDENINMVMSLWFDGPQFPSIIKKKVRVEKNPLLMVMKHIQRTKNKVYHLLQKSEKSQIWSKFKNKKSSNQIEGMTVIKMTVF